MFVVKIGGSKGINLDYVLEDLAHQTEPLVLVHGWPGSVYEFYKIIPMLTEPEKHGGRAEDAFHVVVPSLPGFGFSESPRVRTLAYLVGFRSLGSNPGLHFILWFYPLAGDRN